LLTGLLLGADHAQRVDYDDADLRVVIEGQRQLVRQFIVERRQFVTFKQPVGARPTAKQQLQPFLAAGRRIDR
jgi:hypothetical protein